MKVVEERIIRVPVDEIRVILKEQYGIDLIGIEPYLDGDSLAFSVPIVAGTAPSSHKGRSIQEFRAQLDSSKFDDQQGQASGRKLNEISGVRIETSPRGKKARRRRRKRNRIKTRGWNVVAQITNSKGLVANVYAPLVNALEGKEIARTEQKRIVRQLMIQNGNNPSPESVEYFLENTLEYLHKDGKQVEAAP